MDGKGHETTIDERTKDFFLHEIIFKVYARRYIIGKMLI